MRVQTERDIIKRALWVADRMVWDHIEVIRSCLRELDLEKATLAEVDAVFGSPHWRAAFITSCEECNRPFQKLIHVGDTDETAYEVPSAWLCEHCLREALSLLESAS